MNRDCMPPGGWPRAARGQRAAEGVRGRAATVALQQEDRDGGGGAHQAPHRQGGEDVTGEEVLITEVFNPCMPTVAFLQPVFAHRSNICCSRVWRLSA